MSNTVLIHDPATEKEAELDAISSVIHTYVEGGRKGNSSIIKSAFREDATIHGDIGGSLFAGPIDLLFDWIDDNPPAPNLIAYIVNIDLADTVATARLELHNWLGFQFTDLFTLLKEDGQWIITSKVFHTYKGFEGTSR